MLTYVYVFVITQLGPFEANKLGEVNKNFHAEVVTDTRLNENSVLNGCDGVGLMWKKSLDEVSISGIKSDRICGITLKDPYLVFIFPADQGIQAYSGTRVTGHRSPKSWATYGSR